MSQPSRRRLAFVLFGGLLAVSGCAAGDGLSSPSDPTGDGGAREDDLFSAAGDGGVDTGPAQACAAFVQRVCGPSGADCLDSSACQAALLIERYEPDRCAEGLADNFVYADCEANACERLVTKVCGDDDGCSDDGSCTQAEDLATTAGDVDNADEVRLEAREACGAALADEVIFPSCDK